MTSRKPADDPDDLERYVTRIRRECAHKPPRRATDLPMSMTDTCACGATTYVLRYKGNDGSNRPGKRWDYWMGVRP